MIIDYKVTTWERIEVPKEFEAEVIERMKKGELTSSSDLWDLTTNLTVEKLVDFNEEMSVGAIQEGYTLEVYNDKYDDKQIYNNKDLNYEGQ